MRSVGLLAALLLVTAFGHPLGAVPPHGAAPEAVQDESFESRRVLQSEEVGWWQQVKDTASRTVATPLSAAVQHTWEWMKTSWLNPTANIIYTCLILYMFYSLPTHAALAVGLATFFYGPTVVATLLEGVGVSLESAAANPLYIIVAVWLLMLFNTKVFRVAVQAATQRCAMGLGMDADQSGRVDWLDMLYWMRNLAVIKWAGSLFEGDMHGYFQLQREEERKKPTLAALDARLTRIEEMLEKVLAQAAMKA